MLVVEAAVGRKGSLGKVNKSTKQHSLRRVATAVISECRIVVTLLSLQYSSVGLRADK